MQIVFLGAVLLEIHLSMLLRYAKKVNYKLITENLFL